jgi:predicted metal-dependent phosphoesterase TrpH
MAAWLRGFIWPLAITGVVLASALLGPTALSEPVAGAAPGGAYLEVSWAYLLLAPLFGVLDTLSLLTLDQHYAVLATLIGAFVLWRAARRRTRRGWRARIGIEAGVATACLLGLVAFYGYGIVGPRPMAGLAVRDSTAIVVDFHSHTAHSHDGRAGFGAEDNREWHASAGFDAVYVADHRTYQGYAEGAARNPGRAGDGTVLLPALEIKFANRYASVLGEAWRYRSAMDGNHLIADSLYRATARGAPRPTLVLTIPGRIDSIPAATPDSIGYVAVEVNDASPRGLEQSRQDRGQILRLADSLDLALVASSNNHGWGRTAAAWTVLRIPGWRAMPPQRLSRAIEATLHGDRREASHVVERRIPYPGGSVPALALTVPAITWQMFGGLGSAERVSWLLWAWAIALGFAAAGRRRLEVYTG